MDSQTSLLLIKDHLFVAKNYAKQNQETEMQKHIKEAEKAFDFLKNAVLQIIMKEKNLI